MVPGMNAFITEAEVAEQILACRRELAALKRLLRAVRAAGKADEARRQRRKNVVQNWGNRGELRDR